MPSPSERPTALESLYAAGAHLVLCNRDKRAVRPRWQERPAELCEALDWSELVGLVPASLGMVVVDVDEGDPAEVTQLLGEPLARVATLSGGTHLFYASDEAVGNGRWELPGGARGDLRGARGYVALWNAAAVAEALPRCEVAELVDLSPLRGAPEPVVQEAAAELPPLPPDSASGSGDSRQKYARVALEAEVQAVATTAEGGRNHRLNVAALKAGQLVGAGVLDEAEAHSALLTAARTAGLGESEALATIRSGLEAGKREPRNLSGVGNGGNGGGSAVGKLVPGRGAPPTRQAVWHHPEDPWDLTDYHDDAWQGRMIRLYAERLLAVRDAQDCYRLLVDNGHGVWRESPGQLEGWLTELLWQWFRVALPQVNSPAAMARWVKQRHTQPARLRALDSTTAVVFAWERRNILPPALTLAREQDLDADPRYLGAPNGVVDLDTGRLLTGEAARRCLVTRTLPDPFDPEASYEGVDKLFGHLEEQDREWLLNALGFALRGTPSRRLYLLVGETAGGKSTLFGALQAALGELADAVDPVTLLAPGRGASNTGPRPESERWVTRRLLVCSEPVTGRLDWVGLKAKSGGDSLPHRLVHQNYGATKAVTASLFLACNPASVPMPPLEDAALAERVRVLNYPQVPEGQRDPRLGERLRHLGARQALAALLIRHAVANPVPPEDVPSVAAARAALREEAIGEAGAWLQEVVAEGTSEDWLSTEALWRAARKAAGAPDDAPRAWNRTRRELIALAKNLLPLGNAVQYKRSGQRGRGWRGWKLARSGEVAGELGHANPARSRSCAKKPSRARGVDLYAQAGPSVTACEP